MWVRGNKVCVPERREATRADYEDETKYSFE